MLFYSLATAKAMVWPIIELFFDQFDMIESAHLAVETDTHSKLYEVQNRLRWPLTSLPLFS